MFSYWKLRCLHIWHPQTNFPHIVKTFIVALNFTSLYIYQEPQNQTLYSEFPELNLGLSSLAKPPGSFTQDCHHQDIATSSGCLSSRSRAPKSSLVWVRQILVTRSLLPCRSEPAATYVVIITTAALCVLIGLLCKIQSGTFKKEKVVMKKNLKLLNSTPYQKNYWERTINSWDRIKEKNW